MLQAGTGVSDLASDAVAAWPIVVHVRVPRQTDDTLWYHAIGAVRDSSAKQPSVPALAMRLDGPDRDYQLLFVSAPPQVATTLARTGSQVQWHPLVSIDEQVYTHDGLMERESDAIGSDYYNGRECDDGVSEAMYDSSSGDCDSDEY